MGIKAGSGKGSADPGGSKKGTQDGSFSGGGSNLRRKKLFPPIVPPKEPLQPIPDSPFPETKGFRLGQYLVVEEHDDYLVCKGYNPNSKDPAAEFTPPTYRTAIKVAKPPALQRTPWDGQTVTIDGVDYTYEYSDTEFGVRTAHTSSGDEEQRIDPPYIVDGIENQIIVAVEIKKTAAVEGMEVTDEDGTRLRWIDLNVSGRHWKGPSGQTIIRTDPPNFTIVEVDRADGDSVGYMDRGRRKFLFSASDIAERCIFYSSDNFLYSISGGWINQDNGVLIKWNIDTDSDDCYTPVWYSSEGAMTSPGSHMTTAGVISGTMGNSSGSNANKCEQTIGESSNGDIWVCGGSNAHIAAFDPDTGAQTVDISGITGDALYPADSSGGMLLVDCNGTGGKYLRVFDASGTETASWSTASLGFVEVSGNVVVIATAAGTTLYTVNKSDLTAISNCSAPAGETYIAGTTDGTNVYVFCDHATTPKYRKYLASNLATEDASSPQNADTTFKAMVHMKYANSALYVWSQHVRKISATALTETWEFNGNGIAPSTRINCAVDSSRVYVQCSTDLFFAIDESTGEAVFTESMAGNVWGGIALGDSRLFIAGRRTPA